MASFPTAGSYRLLQFKVDARVHTATVRNLVRAVLRERQ
jgi:hypothetical protein